MNLSKIQVLVIDDDVFKANDIRKALAFSGITNILTVNNQEDAWKEIYKSENMEAKIDLIVTDMCYPLSRGNSIDEEAGFKLIERLNKEKIEIPVIVCSSIKYNVPEILGSVWYNKSRDLEFDFRDVLNRLS
ncbi:response regulator [Roseburia sp. 499]|uniref:response regulator n=1 Tax=Roseburia sp. 499 TaxID=1261634 RepID=UPI0009F8B218|nr:response regulator [Roseburia sp. 499]WVK69418.1 response regulator [Roseburia sp. 499]